MTPSPLTPPPKLVQQWILDKQLGEFYSELNDPEQYFATQAAQWGADQELEACCLWMERNFDDWDNRFSDELRRHRRPKPPSLKERLTKAIQNKDLDTALKLVEGLDDSL
jgi:hypothetical protein